MASKRNLLLFSFVLWGIAFGVSLSPAQLVSGRFVTSFYTWQKFDTVDVSKTYLRAYQTIQLSAAQGDFSLHTYLQGAMNATNDFGDVGRVRVYNLYLTWANIFNAVELDLGRQAVYAGVGNGTIDGAVARARILQNQVVVTGYAGATAPDGLGGVRTNIHDNNEFGGQVTTTAVPGLRAGLSYMNRHESRDPYWTSRGRDSTFTPVPYYVSYESEAEQYGSVDLFYTYNTLFSVYGRYDHDFNLNQTSRTQAGARVNVTAALALTADFIHRAPRISFNSIFTAFTMNTVDEIEGGVEYGFTPLLRAFAKVASVTYSDDKSHRWTLGFSMGYGSISYSGGDGYAGQLQSFNVQGAYPLLDNKVIPSAGISYASYRFSPDSPTRDEALAIVLGSTVRPMKAFSFDVQGQWLTNKIVKQDMRLFLKLNYWFSERLSIFREEGK